MIVSTFTRAPSFLLLQPSSLSRRFTCSFFPGSFMLRLSSSVDCLPPSHLYTNTADRRWRRCHDRVACRPTNPSQSASQQAPNRLVRVSLTLSYCSVWMCAFYRLCVCGSILLPASCVFFSYTPQLFQWLFMIISVFVIWIEKGIYWLLLLERVIHLIDWLNEVVSVSDIRYKFVLSQLVFINPFVHLSIFINQFVYLVDHFTNKSILF